MARPCASVFVMLGELPDANGALKKNSLLFKVYFALSKVFWVLSKALHPLSAVNQNDRAILAFGISLTLLGQTSSRPSGSLRPSRRGCRLPRMARWLPPFRLPHHWCMSSATRCGTWASTTHLLS